MRGRVAFRPKGGDEGAGACMEMCLSCLSCCCWRLTSIYAGPTWEGGGGTCINNCVLICRACIIACLAAL